MLLHDTTPISISLASNQSWFFQTYTYMHTRLACLFLILKASKNHRVVFKLFKLRNNVLLLIWSFYIQLFSSKSDKLLLPICNWSLLTLYNSEVAIDLYNFRNLTRSKKRSTVWSRQCLGKKKKVSGLSSVQYKRWNRSEERDIDNENARNKKKIVP